MTRIVALTGGIGSGKTTVAKLFEKLGVPVIDADAIVHELQAPGTPLLQEIAAAFGRELIGPDGSLDREALGARVFRDPETRGRLERMVHPRVGAEVARRLEAARESGAPLVVLDIPLLFESRRASARPAGASGLDFDAIVVVWSPREVQIERQVRRDGRPREEAIRRVDAQLPLDEKREQADYVIDNSGDLERTEAQVIALVRKLGGAAAAP